MKSWRSSTIPDHCSKMSCSLMLPATKMVLQCRRWLSRSGWRRPQLFL